MFYTQIINKIQKFISELNIRQRANLILSGLLLFTTIAAGLTALTLLPNIDRAKTADAAPVCVGINTFYSTADSLCHERGGFIGTKCFDFSLPDANNNCVGYEKTPLFNCNKNLNGQRQIFATDYDSVCTTLPEYYIKYAECWPRNLNTPELNANMDNMNKIINYENVNVPDGNARVINDNFCEGRAANGSGNGTFFSPCDVGYRIYTDQGYFVHGTFRYIGAYTIPYLSRFACIRKDYVDGTALASSPIDTSVQKVYHASYASNNTVPFSNANNGCTSAYDDVIFLARSADQEDFDMQ